MLGSTLLRYFADCEGFNVFGTVRSPNISNNIPNNVRSHIITNVHADNHDNLNKLFLEINPQVVINCIGLVKQLAESDDPLSAIPINSLLPHRLAKLCKLFNARLIHISTDCVFSGNKGMYRENDPSDANDIYGKTKFLGEVDYANAITLRTSIIGHELEGSRSLVDWFLSQTNSIKGYKRAIFSGLPTIEIARIIRDHVIPYPQLHGLYHVSADPISKYDLLVLIAKIYGKSIEIQSDFLYQIDRSLNSDRFQRVTHYKPKSWPELITVMHQFG